jgi:hypothetical protein
LGDVAFIGSHVAADAVVAMVNIMAVIETTVVVTAVNAAVVISVAVDVTLVGPQVCPIMGEILPVRVDVRTLLFDGALLIYAVTLLVVVLMQGTLVGAKICSVLSDVLSIGAGIGAVTPDVVLVVAGTRPRLTHRWRTR